MVLKVCVHEWLSGGVSPCQGEGRGFESRLVLSMIQKKEISVPRLLIRKHEKVSKINVFKGREHGTKSKNLILTGTKGADVKISALFPVPTP